MKELSLQNCRLDGRYDIQSLLGRGSYAEIYVARDILASPSAPHSQIVIKALNVFMQDDLDADLERTLVENFQNEAIALDRVRHPNIISRLGHGTAKDLRGMVFHYLVLEYLSGGDLAKACPKQGFPLEQALEYLEQVCAGLAHAHKCGVIHRDIKPQNLLLTRDRKTVKIADFGVARFNQSDSPITRVGTNMYAPPEHSPTFVDGETVTTVVKLTPAADIYSLAKSAYVLVTGESPRRFSNAPISDLPISVIDKPWANQFLRVLKKATQSNPADRYQTINDFWKELGEIILFEETDEYKTHVSEPPHPLPQPSITNDFSPNAPVLPKFSTSRDLKYRNGTLEENNPRLVVKIDEGELAKPSPQPRLPENGKPIRIDIPDQAKSKRNFLRRITTFGLLLVLFAGSLYALQSYLRNQRILPEIRNPFRTVEGVANGDVNLRRDADADSQRIGIVPKGSRVKIVNTKTVNTKDIWYEVDVIEFNPSKRNPNDAERGWVHGAYIDKQE
jgi:serine/threonine protein kinase